MDNNGKTYNGSVKTIVYEHLTNGEREGVAQIIHSHLRGADDYIYNNVLVTLPELAFDRVVVTLCLEDIRYLDDINKRLADADRIIMKYLTHVKGSVEEIKKDRECQFVSNADRLRQKIDQVMLDNPFSSNIAIVSIKRKDPDEPVIIIFPATKKSVISPKDIEKLDKEFGKNNYKIAKISHKKYEKLCDKGMDPYEGVLF